ncbi:MAG TPA: 50S ribosomal protein L25/general stress protein Ctc [Actinomycetota bacterium]|nr:50S ribosomal protein L25/general stress protein Ctc [Actinomycetota bacterium]
MAEIRLKANKRGDAGKGSARRTRAAGRVPAVVYGRGMDPVAISVDRREFVTALLSDSGMNTLLDLEIDGDTTLALTRELQRDPVRGTLLHADFVKVDRTVEVEVEVPIHIVGEAPGAKEGGILENPLFTVHVRSLPGDVPEAIDADVSHLNMGDSLRVEDLAAGRAFTILDDPETVVASVVAPISEEALASLEADAGVTTEPTDAEAAETARLGAEGATGDEIAEGDAGGAAAAE